MSLFLNPLWLIVLPLAMAPVVYVVRRRGGLAGLLSAASALFVARLCASMPFDWSMEVLGREMRLHPGERLFLAYAFLLVAFYFLYTRAVSQGWSFSPFILVIMSIFVAAVMIQNMTMAVLLLGMAATVAVLIVQAGQRARVDAGLQYLVTMGLAIPPLLLAAHLTEMRILDPSGTALPRIAGFFLVLGAILLFGAVPFQSWTVTVSGQAPPLVSAFLFSVGSGVVVFKLLELFHRFPWLMMDGNVAYLLFVAGLGSVVVGGVLAAVQREFGGLLAWSVLIDTGFLLIGLSSSSVEMLAVLTLMVLNRGISVSLFGMGLGVLRRERVSHAFADMSGVIWQKPLAVLAVGVGALSLVGFPLTGGFTARWLAVQSLPAEMQRWVTVLILASIIASLGVLRGVAATLGDRPTPSEEAESSTLRLLVLGFVLVSMLLALYPQTVLDPFASIMSSLVILR